MFFTHAYENRDAFGEFESRSVFRVVFENSPKCIEMKDIIFLLFAVYLIEYCSFTFSKNVFHYFLSGSYTLLDTFCVVAQ